MISVKRAAPAFALILATAFSARAGIVFDLASDWSDTNNPNGVWSYDERPGVALANHLSN